MNILILLITILAAHRITHFLTDDLIFSPIRQRLILRWAANDRDTFFSEALVCAWCMGFWVSAALVGALCQVISIPLPALVALAVSSAVGLIEDWSQP